MNLVNRFLERENFADYDDFSHNFALNVPKDFNFGFDVVDVYAKIAPAKMALVWCNDKGDEKRFTFADMKRESDKTANLLKKYDVKKGDVVMTMLARRYEYWLLAVACHKVGAILIPATFLLCAKDIIYRTKSAEVKLIVSINEDDVIKHIDEAKGECPTVKTIMLTGERDGYINFDAELEKSSCDFIPTEKVGGLDNLLIYFTSGTTGYPKMVAHNHTYPIAHIVTAKYWQCVVDDGLHLTVAETGWAKCSWGRIYGQWIAGTAIFVYDYFGKFSPLDLLPLIAKYGITTFCAPPTIYRFFIKEDMSRFDFSTLVHCTTAGEPLSPEVAKQFMIATKQEIKEGFGQSETVVLLGTFYNVASRYGSMGKKCPIYDIVLLDNNNQPVALGENGELCVKLPHDKLQLGLLCEYYKNPEKTQVELREDYYHTGDLAYEDQDGYFWFVGRKDDIIKSSGYRIGPFEVESALMEHPSVMECAITGVPDPLRGQIVKATIVLAKGYEPSDELIKELQNHVKHATAPYKYPRVIDFVKELPKTISGKILRKDIRGDK